MKKTAWLWLLVLPRFAFAATAAKTMRLDYFHTGNASQEIFSFDRMVLEPLPWPGNPATAIDDTNLGKYFFEVVDRGDQPRPLLARLRLGLRRVGDDGRGRSTHRGAPSPSRCASRLPDADRSQVVVKKRDRENAFREVWTDDVDPDGPRSSITAAPPSPGPLLELQKSGDSAEKVDFLILGDGYTAAETAQFEKDARRLDRPPVRRLALQGAPRRLQRLGRCVRPPTTSGISRPSTGLHRSSRVGATYDAFGVRALHPDLRQPRASATSRRSRRTSSSRSSSTASTYGGGGIFNLYSTVAADSLWAPYVFVHEFGHHFAGLADEYYTSAVAYAPATPSASEPWEPNVTALPTRTT